MEKEVKFSKIKLDSLRYFKECREDDSDDFFLGEYTSDQLKEILLWMMYSKYLTNCGSLKYKLTENGLNLLKKFEEFEQKTLKKDSLVSISIDKSVNQKVEIKGSSIHGGLTQSSDSSDNKKNSAPVKEATNTTRKIIIGVLIGVAGGVAAGLILYYGFGIGI